MERRNIPMQYGIHRSPSVANEGELSECINIEAHNGELTPSVMPEVAFTLPEGATLLFVHTSGSYKNYIIQQGTNLCWISDNDKNNVKVIGNITPTSIHSVGNTLIILSENRMEYILYKTGKYKRIGSRPPFCSISFGLSYYSNVNIIPRGKFTIKSSASDLSDFWVGFKRGIIDYIDEGKAPNHVSFLSSLDEIENETGVLNKSNFVKPMTEAIFPIINKIVDSNRRYGCFMHPFYLRYAYRMYDGSHYMHSAPILFPVNMMGPVCIATGYKIDTYDYTFYFAVDMDVTNLNYSITGFYDENGNKVSSELMKDWEDIINGVDVFVSNPIYPYKQDGYATGYWGTENIYGSSLKTTSRVFDVNDVLKPIYKNILYSDAYPTNKLAFTIEDNYKFTEQIESSGLFFKVSEFSNVDSLITLETEGRKPLPIDDGVLSNLQQQEVLEDDYDSHNSIIPSFAYTYNGRLNISGIKTKIFKGYPLESMVPYTYIEGENSTFEVRTEIEIDGAVYQVASHNNIQLHERPPFIYYPNSNCTIFIIAQTKYNGERFILMPSASSHKLLNGSYYLSDSYGVNDDYYQGSISSANEPPFISYPNKIYTSEVNNPFFFPLSGRNDIGTGEIIAITSNTKAISPGQFGQYPLIVFSTDGVWAMQTGEEGLYYSVHPISKDICVNPNILQTNGPVLFATHNGLYSVIGEEVTNLSKSMKGRPEIFQIPELDNEYTYLQQTASDTESFNEFIKDAFFADDYINKRAVIYNPNKDYAYTYCLDCGMFAKMVVTKNGVPVRFQNLVKAYPEVYMQSGTDVYTFVPDKDKDQSLTQHGLLVTRPMSFADPLALKVINDVKLIYKRSSSSTRCRYALYVSNDGYNWIQRKSLHGHSFKFFRFVIFTKMADPDALVAMSVMFDYRRTNKLR